MCIEKFLFLAPEQAQNISLPHLLFFCVFGTACAGMQHLSILCYNTNISLCLT